MSANLRVTGGSIRNRRLHSPPRNSIRPASDMLRQAVFNMLGDAVEGKAFHDVFAGTGIVGVEALSRGASRALFIERDRDVLVLLKRNLAIAKFGDAAAIRSMDAFVWAEGFRPLPEGNIVFVGPPYPLFSAEKDRARLDALVVALQQRLGDADWLVYQYAKHVDPESLPDASSWVRQRKYGKTRLGIWQRGRQEGDPIRTDGAPDADDETDDDAGEDHADDAPHAADA